MTEQELSIKFCSFLENEKKYPSNSLLQQTSFWTENRQRIQIDLLLLDTRIGEYIGLIEFKDTINPDKKKRTKLQIEKYLEILKIKSLPYYLVFPLDEENFQILVIGDDDDWKSISLEEFPEFETLSAKKKIEDKESTKELEEIIEKEIEYKKKNKAQSSLWALTSIIVGILGAILSFYLSNNFNKSGSEILFSNNEIIKLKEQINNISTKTAKNDTLFIKDSSFVATGFNRRLKVIENGLLNNPEKTLEIRDIYKQIEIVNQKIEYQNKLIELRNENLLTRIEWLNALVIGIILALFGSAIGYVITNFTERKNNR